MTFLHAFTDTDGDGLCDFETDFVALERRCLATEREHMTVIRIDPGRVVVCDDCNADYTDSPASGGLLFQSKAICPTCAPKWEQGAKRHGEEQLIRARCPAGKAFAEWVRQDLR